MGLKKQGLTIGVLEVVKKKQMFSAFLNEKPNARDLNTSSLLSGSFLSSSSQKQMPILNKKPPKQTKKQQERKRNAKKEGELNKR